MTKDRDMISKELRTAMKKILLACGIALSLIGTSAGAQQSGNAVVEVQKPWARATTGTTGAAYLSITNNGTASDRLIGAKTPIAEKAEIHESKMKDGMMEMRPVGPLPIKAGPSATLKPGAMHMMLIGLSIP
jgi:periplasmic copper chaperone A